MTNEHDSDRTSPAPGKDSTVTDWHGQEVDRDIEAADEALEQADGDEAVAEEIFEDTRPDHPSDEYKVPAEDREGTLVTETDDT